MWKFKFPVPIQNCIYLVFGWFKKYDKLYDRELIELFKSKQDINALGVLFSRYSHLVASIAIGILKDKQKAEDVVQEIFEIVSKDLVKHDVKNFNSWIYSVTKFHCFKVKKVIEFVQSDIELGDEDDSDEILEFELQLQTRIKHLKKAMSLIKYEQKKCVELFYLKGYSYNEIADETEYTMNEVKSFIQNGKRNLKSLIIANAIKDE